MTKTFFSREFGKVLKKQLRGTNFPNGSFSRKHLHSINVQAIQVTMGLGQYLDALESTTEIVFHLDSYFPKQLSIADVTLPSSGIKL